MYVCEPINGWSNDGNGDESEVQSRATQQLINVFRDSVAKQQELSHMLMGVIRAEVADCDVVDG